MAEKKYSDANIADPERDDLPCAKPCPPASDSIRELTRVVMGWLELEKRIPRSFVMCIPSKCIEAWTGIALYGRKDSDLLYEIECRSDIENYLAQKPARERLIRNRKGRMKKATRRYSEKSDQITSQWNYVTSNCDQARIFTEHIVEVGSIKRLLADKGPVAT